MTALKRQQRHKPLIELVPTPAERETAYYAALELVAQIDDQLTRGVRHYRNTSGKLLNTLDEVINAFLNNELLMEQEEQAFWGMRERLAA